MKVRRDEGVLSVPTSPKILLGLFIYLKKAKESVTPYAGEQWEYRSSRNANQTLFN